MAPYLIYIIKWALALTILYSLYGIFLRKETFHGMNRFVLLGILLGSMMLPICQLPTSNKLSNVVQTVERSVSQEAGTLEENMPAFEEITTTSAQQTTISTTPLPETTKRPALWFIILVGTYLLGLVISWALYLRGYVSLWSIIRYGQRVKRNDVPEHVHLVINEKATMPCSWMRWIMLTSNDLEQNGQMIIRHEMAHIRKHHSWDMLLCDITTNMLWFLPFVYILRTDLRDVHEYQADKAVIQGTDDQDLYQRLLIAKASVTTSQPIVNNLNASAVKKRLQMMLCKESNRFSRMKVLYILPLMTIVLMAYARPNIIQEVEQGIAQEEQKVEAMLEKQAEPMPTEEVVAELPEIAGEEPIEEEVKADHKPNYTITVTATNGVEDTAYELYKTENGFSKVDLGSPIFIDEKTLGDNRQVTFQVYLDQPTRLILMGKRVGKKVQYSIPAFPGSHAKIRTKSNDIEISGTGFYKEYTDALEYSRNSTLQHTSKEAKELRRRYFINHSAEQGCLYAYQREMLLPIEDIFELFPDSLYDTTYGKLIKQAAESAIKREESKYDDESIMFDDDEALMGTN